jgi:hypothetical protein
MTTLEPTSVEQQYKIRLWIETMMALGYMGLGVFDLREIIVVLIVYQTSCRLNKTSAITSSLLLSMLLTRLCVYPAVG